MTSAKVKHYHGNQLTVYLGLALRLTSLIFAYRECIALVAWQPLAENDRKVVIGLAHFVNKQNNAI
jgi:hypothetical protein